jgi:hypothetical protein
MATVASEFGSLFKANPLNIAPLGLHSQTFLASSSPISQMAIADHTLLDIVKINLPPWPGTKRISEIDVPEMPEMCRVRRGAERPPIHRWARRHPFVA